MLPWRDYIKLCIGTIVRIEQFNLPVLANLLSNKLFRGLLNFEPFLGKDYF